MSAKTNKLTYAVIALFVCLIVVLASLIALVNLKQAQNNHDVRRGAGIGERQFQLVDNSLINYVNLTTELIQREGAHPDAGRAMGWRAGYANLRWIGSPDDSVKSIKNIHLVVYTRLDVKNSFGLLDIALYAVANLTQSVIPNDVYGHQEITIPILGVNNPTYSFFFNCSSYF